MGLPPATISYRFCFPRGAIFPLFDDDALIEEHIIICAASTCLIYSSLQQARLQHEGALTWTSQRPRKIRIPRWRLADFRQGITAPCPTALLLRYYILAASS